MSVERLQLLGAERVRYFAPTAICGYLAGLCGVLMVASAFLRHMPDAIAITAAGLFGLVMSGGLGLLFWQAQRHDLNFERWSTAATSLENFDTLRAAVARVEWTILREDRGQRLEVRTAGTDFSAGERVSIQFRGSDVLVASICDPAVGFSMVGRRRCREHREFVRRSLRLA